MGDVTRILNTMERGDGDPEREETRLGTHAKATDELLSLVYEELRLLAAQKLSQEAPGQTLQATALVHEAYLRLVEEPGPAPAGQPQNWNSRGHFFAAAAEAMRRILVENARRKKSLKHGGGHSKVAGLEVGDLSGGTEIGPEDLLALDEALERLTAEDHTLTELIKLHCFAGLPLAQVAEILGVSSRTAERQWAFARAWLHREIRGKG